MLEKTKIKTYQKIQHFKVTQEKIEKLEFILNLEKNDLKSQKRQMYKFVHTQINILFRNSKATIAKVMLKGKICDWVVTEDFCGKYAIKNFAWILSEFLLSGNGYSHQINTKSIEDFIFTPKETDELNTILSENLGVHFSLLNESFFVMMKK